MLPGRILLAALAIACSAWFALGGYSAHERTRLSGLLAAPRYLTAQQERSARSLLEHARLLNPDRDVELQAAGIALHTGRPRVAERILQQVVAREPKNINAWLLLEVTADNRDQPVSDGAGAQVRMLAPPAQPAP
ncbi:MAG: hypothetical protein NVS3B18_16180 [Candidatus Dormibacteria bacterium]